MRDTQLAMGQPSAHSTYVHLYVNGLYWGLYNPSERPDDAFLHEYDRLNVNPQSAGDEDWDVFKDARVFNGEEAAWDELMGNALSGLSTQAAYQRIQGNNADGTRNPNYPVLLDVDSLIDYMILHLYACSEDWPHHNWYAGRSRTDLSRGWRFFVWDQEIVMDFKFRKRIDVSNYDSPAVVYSALRKNSEFRLRFADRIQRHLFNDGPLSIDGARRIWQARADEIDRAIIAESARWGDFRLDVPDIYRSSAALYTREDHWLPEKQKVLDEYIPKSHELAMERFRSANLYPSIDPPQFSQHGGVIAHNGEFKITRTSGTIYYTLDGSDPRLIGGDVSPTAIRGGSSASLTLSATTLVRTRVLRSGTWSALQEAVFVVDEPLALRLTEIHYHPEAPPAGSDFDEDDFEFLELQNVGETPIALYGVQITGGVRFNFGRQEIWPLESGQVVLLVEDLAAFKSRYDTTEILIGGVYSGKLSNSGEDLTLIDARGEIVLNITYEDTWYPTTDGTGRSLEIKDAYTSIEDWSLRNSWKASADNGGTPGVNGLD
jgi:hypothetical protein